MSGAKHRRRIIELAGRPVRLLYDNFNRANANTFGVATSGQAWDDDVAGDSSSIIGNQGAGGPTGAGGTNIDLGTTYPGLHLKATIAVKGVYQGFFFSDQARTSNIFVYHGTTAEFLNAILVSVNTGSGPDILAHIPYVFVPGDQWDIKTLGTSIIVLINGVEILALSDVVPANTGRVVSYYDGSDVGRIDEVEVWTIAQY